MTNNSLERCDASFLEVINFILNQRVKRNIDKKTESFRRMTKAIANLISNDERLQERLIIAHLEDDRRRNKYE